MKNPKPCEQLRLEAFELSDMTPHHASSARYTTWGFKAGSPDEVTASAGSSPSDVAPPVMNIEGRKGEKGELPMKSNAKSKCDTSRGRMILNAQSRAIEQALSD